jgi:hypothetical protein
MVIFKITEGTCTCTLGARIVGRRQHDALQILTAIDYASHSGKTHMRYHHMTRRHTIVVHFLHVREHTSRNGI